MKRKLSVLLVATLFSILIACNSNSSEDAWISEGIWRAEVVQNDSTSTPFLFELSGSGDSLSMTIQNAEERIEVSRIRKQGDTLKVDLPVFNSSLDLYRVDKDHMEGSFFHGDGQYSLPVRAVWGDSLRFPIDGDAPALASRYRIIFYPGEERERLAVGEFHQEGNQVRGTILNPSGNYRHLEGVVDQNSLRLSTFDGRTVYLFEAQERKDTLVGWWISGSAEPRKWIGYPDDEVELPDPDSIIFIKPGYEGIEIAFPTPEGKMIESDPSTQAGNVTIFTVMGSWCPNCMDEARFLTRLYQEYHDKGLNIIGLSFERPEDFDGAAKAVQKMRSDLGIPYPVVIAGRPDKEGKMNALPMLSDPPSFPTAIYVGKDGRVRRIHKGFNGPGSSGYEEFEKETEKFIRDLLEE